MLARAEAAALRAAQALAVLGLLVLILFAAATLADGLLRSLADRPIDLVDDIGSYVVACAVASCFPLAQLRHANITIEIVGIALGPRVRQALRAFAAILVAVTMVAMARQLLIYASHEASGGDSSVMLGIPTSPFWYVVAVMFVIAAVAQLLVAVLELARCGGALQPAPPSGMH